MKQSILKSPLFLITIGLNSPLRGVVAWGHEVRVKKGTIVVTGIGI